MQHTHGSEARGINGIESQSEDERLNGGALASQLCDRSSSITRNAPKIRAESRSGSLPDGG